MFCTSHGTALDSANVRRMFRNLCTRAGLNATEWTPRELRHSLVSLMSEAGVPVKEIARLVGHGSTKETETVYCKRLRPVLTGGAQVMDRLFDWPSEPPRAGRTRRRVGHSATHSPRSRKPSAWTAEGLQCGADPR